MIKALPPVSCTDCRLRSYIAVSGAESRAVGTITRKDGKQQVTLAGWPLYRFVGDTKPGDIAGQCKGGFLAVTPSGGKSM